MFCSVNDSACLEISVPGLGIDGDRFVGGLEKHAERPLGLIDGLFGQIAQLGRHFQFRFGHRQHSLLFLVAQLKGRSTVGPRRRTGRSHLWPSH